MLYCEVFKNIRVQIHCTKYIFSLQRNPSRSNNRLPVVVIAPGFLALIIVVGVSLTVRY
jgi:hypothetical protein